MAKKNKGKDKATNKALRNKVSYYLIMLRKQRLTLEEFEFYCSELDFNLLQYEGKDKEHWEKLYKAWSAWAIRHQGF